MKFKLVKTNMAPPSSQLEDWEVSIQVSDLVSRHGARDLLGLSCRSQADLDEVVEGFVIELKKLRFPKSNR